jgi:GTPase SAR1 family protein
MAEPELKRIKILLMGQPNTGKTNLMLRYFKNGFDENYEPTQGTHMATRKFNYKKSQLDVEVLEIGGAALKNLIPQTLHGKLLLKRNRRNCLYL